MEVVRVWVEPTGLADEGVVRCERMRGVKENTKGFELTAWKKAGVPF